VWVIVYYCDWFGSPDFLSCVAGTRKNRQARIFGEAGICQGEFTQEENRAASGFDAASVNAIGAQTGTLMPFRLVRGSSHGRRITQAVPDY
jgi:hypothetical protein